MNKIQRKVLVTGAGGYIGKTLVELLLSYGHTVHSMLWSGNSEEKAVEGSIPFRGDICNREDLNQLSRIPFDYIYHLAARANVPLSVQDPLGDFYNNVEGTINALELARKISAERFILISSASVLDPSNNLPYREDAHMGPTSPYAAGKLAAEAYCKAYHRSYGLSTGVVRLFNVYGPGFKRYSIWDMTNKIIDHSGDIELYGGGEQVRDFLFITDAVRGIECVAEKGSPGEVYHLSSGEPIQIKELAKIIGAYCGFPNIRIRPLPPLPGDVSRWYACLDKIRRLGFSPEVSLEEGLRRSINWVISERKAMGKNDGRK